MTPSSQSTESAAALSLEVRDLFHGSAQSKVAIDTLAFLVIFLSALMFGAFVLARFYQRGSP
ncbi:hypothetical protein [Asticcacaulis excentricus]|uniref:Uncharacterized protein n=1 Tax=Asticcacaulis excentricus TaxID=78587 RepID=A0A3G9G5Q1_9CAUL|nr:hypothetical protein [Asticcacaulis excentricus]BBF80423.1 hypothetical protein EM6_1007 [Asticcacaulis excentricus]